MQSQQPKNFEDSFEVPVLLLEKVIPFIYQYFKQYLLSSGFQEEYNELIYLQQNRPLAFKDQIVFDLIVIFHKRQFDHIQEIWMYFIRKKAPQIILNCADIISQQDRNAFLAQLHILQNEVKKSFPFMGYAMYINGILSVQDLNQYLY